jgi:hypothetical protein
MLFPQNILCAVLAFFWQKIPFMQIIICSRVTCSSSYFQKVFIVHRPSYIIRLKSSSIHRPFLHLEIVASAI